MLQRRRSQTLSISSVTLLSATFSYYRHFSGDETIGDVEQDLIESKKDNRLVIEKAKGNDNLAKL